MPSMTCIQVTGQQLGDCFCITVPVLRKSGEHFSLQSVALTFCFSAVFKIFFNIHTYCTNRNVIAVDSLANEVMYVSKNSDRY